MSHNDLHVLESGLLLAIYLLNGYLEKELQNAEVLRYTLWQRRNLLE